MKYPNFFNNVPTITLYDPLAKLLGAFKDGMITYSYLDAVKLAGHSCPTVAGAYLMLLRALEALYDNNIPVRGNIIVTCKDARNFGVTGVIANVFTLVSGAAAEEGFRGLNGRYSRNNLLHFSAAQNVPFIFTCKDSNKSVSVIYNPSAVVLQPIPPELMQAITTSNATPEMENNFAQIWQQNVKTILEAHHNPDLIKVERLN